MRAVAFAAYALFVILPFAPAFAADAAAADGAFLAPDAVADGILTRKAAFQAVKKTPSIAEPVAAAVDSSAGRDNSERALVSLVFEGGDW